MKKLPMDVVSTGHTDSVCYAIIYAWSVADIEKKQKAYFKEYHPHGYATRVAYYKKTEAGYYKMRINRWHSCD